MAGSVHHCITREVGSPAGNAKRCHAGCKSLPILLQMHGAVIQVGARSVRDKFARCPGAKVLLGAAGSLLPDGRK